MRSFGTSSANRFGVRAVVAKLGGASARRSKLVIGVWAVLAVVSLALMPQLFSTLRMPPLTVPGSQSEIGQRAVADGFPAFGAERMALVFHSRTLRTDDPTFRLAVAVGTSRLRGQRGVETVRIDPPVTSGRDDAHTMYAVAGLSGSEHARTSRISAQRAALERATSEASGGEVTTSMVGMSSLAGEIIDADLAGVRRAETVALPIAALVLLLGLGTLGAALVPLVCGGVAVTVAVGVLSVYSLATPVSTLALALTLTLGWALSLDYAVLLVLRYRRELATGAERHEALRRASATAGVTVCMSSLAVIVCTSTLLVVAAPVFREACFGAVITALVTVAAAVTLFPALLAAAGRRLEFGRLPWHSPERALRQHGGWSRWTHHLMRHPWPYLIAGSLLLVAAALPLAHLRAGFDFDRSSLEGTDVGQGITRIEDSSLPGMTGLMTVVLPREEGAPAPEVRPLTNALSSDPQVAELSVLDNGGNMSLVFIVPTEPADSPRTFALVDRLRETADQYLPEQQRAYVTGTSAMVHDLTQEGGAKFPWAAGLMLGLAAVFLCVCFRSLLVPLKAIVMNVLGVAAALGLLVLVVQDYNAGTVNVVVPLVTFAAVFALSMDYEIFLVRRIQENYESTGDNTASVAVGVQDTGRAITLAAAVMVTLYAGLLTAHRAEMQQIGLALALSIAIDATIVRLVLVPTTMQLLGRYNWWLPGRSLRRERGVRTSRETSREPVGTMTGGAGD